MKTFAIAALSALVSFVAVAHAYDGEDFAARATVPIEQAANLALKAQPGEIVDKELEEEKGGSGLRYTFEIRSGETDFEVGVDAADGTVLEIKKEGAD